MKHHKKKRFIENYNDFYPDSQLDYHEFGRLTLYDIEKLLNDFLEDSYASGYHKVLVITGKGEVVRPTVGKLLQKHSLVEKHNTAGYFNGQDGAYEVYLK